MKVFVHPIIMCVGMLETTFLNLYEDKKISTFSYKVVKSLRIKIKSRPHKYAMSADTE